MSNLHARIKTPPNFPNRAPELIPLFSAPLILLADHLGPAAQATQSQAFPGFPYTNVDSYADGPVSQSTGRLLFYLTELDAAASDARHNPNVSFVVTEAEIHQLPGSSCASKDPEVGAEWCWWPHAGTGAEACLLLVQAEHESQASASLSCCTSALADLCICHH